MGGLSPRGPPSAEGEGLAPAYKLELRGGCLMGAVGSAGPAGVTLQFAFARRAPGSWATLRALDNRPPPKAGPRLLATASEVIADTVSS